MQGKFSLHESWTEHKEIEKLFNVMVVLNCDTVNDVKEYTAMSGLLTPDDNVLFYSDQKGFNCMGFGVRIDKPIGWKPEAKGGLEADTKVIQEVCDLQSDLSFEELSDSIYGAVKLTDNTVATICEILFEAVSAGGKAIDELAKITNIVSSGLLNGSVEEFAEVTEEVIEEIIKEEKIEEPVKIVVEEEKDPVEIINEVANYSDLKWSELRHIAKEKGFDPSNYPDSTTETLINFLESLD